MRASYPKYKSTSIPWLPEMPEHWDVRKAKFIFKKEKREVREDDDVVTAFRDGQVTLRKNRREDGFTIAVHEIGYQGIRKGDLVIHGMDAFAGAIGVSDSDGKASPVYNACTLRVPGNMNYFCYAIRQMSKSGFIQSLAKGIRERSTDFRYDTFGQQSLPFPPLGEQTAIANYLDAKTEQINRFIEKKEKLIALLKEQKQAVINELLSQNTDKWNLVKLKYILSEVNERSETGMEELLSLSKYQGVIPKSKLEERAGGANSLIGYKKVYFDSIVVNKMQASNGIIGVSKVEGITSPDYSIYRVKSNEYSPDFIGHMLIQPDILAEYKRVSTGVMDGYIRLYTDDLFDIKIAIPGKSLQLEVLKRIEQATTQINLTINQVEKEVGKVKELKQSLIAEVVTGRIKVA